MKLAVIEQGGKDYHYKLYDEFDYRIGDYVIVSGKCKEVVKIKNIIDVDEYKGLVNQEVIAKLANYDRYKKRLFAHEQIFKINTELLDIVQKAKAEITAESLAEIDENVAGLLRTREIYESIIGGN